MTQHPISHPRGFSGFRSLVPWLIVLILVSIIHFFFIHLIDPYFVSIIMYAGINIILAVSLNLVNGFTGQFSMGHAGFMSVGGYASAYLTTLFFKLSDMQPDQAHVATQIIFFAIALLAGGFVAAAAGYLVGLPSLRLKGDYLAIVTLGFGEIIRVVILNIDAIGGARGMPSIAPLTNFGVLYTLVVASVFTIWRIMNSQYGRAFLAVREDEIAAESMGVHTTQAKVRAFVMGSFWAGIAGGLFAHYLRYLNPQTFDFNKSFEVIIMVVLGGMGSISGSVIAAIFLTGIREALRPLQEITRIDFRMVIYSLMLIILMLTRPNGLFGTKEITDYLPKWLRKKLFGDSEASL